MALLSDDGELSWIFPASIDLPDILKQKPPLFSEIPDHFYFILDYICSQLDYTDLRLTNGYVNVNAEILKKHNYNYKLYLEYLVKTKVLKGDNHFIIGSKSRGYMFNERYLDHDVQKVVASWYTLAKRVKREIRLKHQQQAEFSFLGRWFNANLQIDQEKAFQLVDELYPLPNYPPFIRGRLRNRPNPKVQRFKAKRAIEKVVNQEYYYGPDDNVGRFHTNLTNLKREVRRLVTYEGSHLINVDISNAQPLFSVLLLKKDFYEGRMPLSINNFPITKKLFKNKSDYKNTIEEILHYITLVKSHESFSGGGFPQFLEMVESGQFYRQAFTKIFPGREFNKTLIKDAIFQTFFSANQFIGQKEAAPKKAFSKAYPEVYGLFKLLKKKRKVVLSHLLQGIEGFLMIECVARRISLERPELPIFTVHDSVLTIPGNEVYVAEVIKEEIYKWTGLNAHIKFEQ